jgi:hypothetical protein
MKGVNAGGVRLPLVQVNKQEAQFIEGLFR